MSVTKSGRKDAGGKRAHEDRALWEHTAQSVTPLKRGKGRHHPASDQLEREVASAGQTAAAKRSAKSPPAKPRAMPARAQPPVSAAAMRPPAPPPIAGFDRKKVRKIRTGQVDIEARIDLHGMRQDEAHAALVHFLHRCQGQGRRWVLVITGKGKAGADAEDHYAPFDMSADRRRGVLRRNVPRWLDDPELRPLVVSYAAAALVHGGEGALYVHLRKRR